MYKTHQPRIQRYALASADNMSRVIYMVSLSIQQPWYAVGNQLEDVDNLGLKSRYAWGMKAQTIGHVQKHKQELFLALHEYKAGEIDLPELLVIFASVSGLGMVKAGFVLQHVRQSRLLDITICVDITSIQYVQIRQSRYSCDKTQKG